MWIENGPLGALLGQFCRCWGHEVPCWRCFGQGGPGNAGTALYGQPRPYQQRCCIWPHCAQRGLLDDVPHVLFNCPLHQAERTPFLAGVNTRLIGLGLRLSDMGPPASQVSFLLGSVPPPMAQHAGGVEHRDILRDVARYLATVRYHRWSYARYMWGHTT